MQPIFTKFLRMSDDFKPLGPAIKRPVEPKPDKYEQFRRGDHFIADVGGERALVDEHNCKQPKGDPTKWLADHGLIEGAAQATNKSKTMQSQSQDSAPAKNAPASPNRTSAIPAGDGGPVRQFKAGDRVRVMQDPDTWWVLRGKTGTVRRMDNEQRCVSVDIDGMQSYSFLARGVELIPELGTTPEAREPVAWRLKHGRVTYTFAKGDCGYVEDGVSGWRRAWANKEYFIDNKRYEAIHEGDPRLAEWGLGTRGEVA